MLVLTLLLLASSALLTGWTAHKVWGRDYRSLEVMDGVAPPVPSAPGDEQPADYDG